MKKFPTKSIIFCLVFLGLLLNPAFLLSGAEVEYTSYYLRDPFQSPFETGKEVSVEPKIEVGLSHLSVQGMIWGSEMPQAIINNSVVKVGEIIEGAEILNIRKEGVYVLYEGRQYILRPSMAR